MKKHIFYELKGNKKLNEKIEDITPEETKKIIYDYLEVKEEEKLYDLLTEEKKIFLRKIK